MENLKPSNGVHVEAPTDGEGARSLGASALNSVVDGVGQSDVPADPDSVAQAYINWQDEANCLGVDPDLFFPERGASTREAKEICRGCVVRLECLKYALTNGEKFGIWGGLSERERRRLRRQRALAARNVTA